MSYSYFEKDKGQLQNFQFFIAAGMGIHGQLISLPVATDFSVVVNGGLCTPCKALRLHVNPKDLRFAGLARAYFSSRIALLHRDENLGMDFAAHNVSPYNAA